MATRLLKRIEKFKFLKIWTYSSKSLQVKVLLSNHLYFNTLNISSPLSEGSSLSILEWFPVKKLNLWGRSWITIGMFERRTSLALSRELISIYFSTSKYFICASTVTHLPLEQQVLLGIKGGQLKRFKEKIFNQNIKKINNSFLFFKKEVSFQNEFWFQMILYIFPFCHSFTNCSKWLRQNAASTTVIDPESRENWWKDIIHRESLSDAFDLRLWGF